MKNSLSSFGRRKTLFSNFSLWSSLKACVLVLLFGTAILWCGAKVFAGAEESSETITAATAPAARAMQTIHDDVVGVSATVPAEWRVQKDPVLFNTYGFALFDPRSPKAGGHERSPVARIALAYQAKPNQIERLVRTLMKNYKEFPLTRSEVSVGNNLNGVAVSGLPGTDPYTLVYVADGERVYRIGLWTQEPGLDAAAKQFLSGLRFEQPKLAVNSLNLVPVEKAMRASLPPDVAARNKRDAAEHAALVAEAKNAPAPTDAQEPMMVRASAQTTCEFGQPNSLYWQLYWDNSNYFYSGYTTSYSGAYYNLRPGDYGWSAMSGNGGSWWGQNYHVNKCDPNHLNQYYANDWPAHKYANVYSGLVGTVEWAGWDYYNSEGYYTLGNYVVVRNGYYRVLMAHLTSIASGITWGASVGASTVIGYAGNTGGPWDEHIHARVAYNESLTYNGEPYGGNTVWPTRLRCYYCRSTDAGASDGYADGQYDLILTNGAKYYTRFYYGRWMKS